MSTHITQTIYLEGSPSALIMILSKGAVALKVVVTHSEDNLWPTIPATTATAAAAAAAAATASVSGSSTHGGGSSQYTAGTSYGNSSIANITGTVLIAIVYTTLIVIAHL
jgi:hypothetical protein